MYTLALMVRKYEAVRKVRKVGGSLTVTIPEIFVRRMGILAGDYVVLSSRIYGGKITIEKLEDEKNDRSEVG